MAGMNAGSCGILIAVLMYECSHTKGCVLNGISSPSLAGRWNWKPQGGGLSVPNFCSERQIGTAKTSFEATVRGIRENPEGPEYKEEPRRFLPKQSTCLQIQF